MPRKKTCNALQVCGDTIPDLRRQLDRLEYLTFGMNDVVCRGKLSERSEFLERHIIKHRESRMSDILSGRKIASKSGMVSPQTCSASLQPPIAAYKKTTCPTIV